jgi:outer membrane protein OmpA-like peptidoglycan-associated protein
MDHGMNEYGLFDDQPTGLARWLLPAFIISLLLHVAVFVWVRDVGFQPFSTPPKQEVPIPTIKLQKIEIPPEILQSQPQPKPEKHTAAAPQAVQLPKDNPSFASMMATSKGAPAAPQIENPMLAEKPKVEATTYKQTVQAAQEGGVKSVAGKIDQVRQDLLEEKPGIEEKPLLDTIKTGEDSGASPTLKGPLAGASTPGFSNLDDLLAQTGPLSKETAPIRMDSDVLFEFDSYQMQPQSVDSLRKLGTIIQRNPQLDFTIEGHSDSFGSDDYDMQLSQLRAEAVKAWLVQTMAIDPSHIQTRGFGKTRLLVPATGAPTDENIQAERINRRVEIVLHDHAQTP